MSDLTSAVKAQKADLVKAFLVHGANPNEVDFTTTPLMEAILCRSVAIVQLLLQYGADANKIVGAQSALILAAGLGLDTLVEVLLTAGADINISTDDGVNPLISASYGGHILTVEILLARGAEVDRGCGVEGWTAYEWAKRRGYTDVAELLERSNIRTSPGSVAVLQPQLSL